MTYVGNVVGSIDIVPDLCHVIIKGQILARGRQVLNNFSSYPEKKHSAGKSKAAFSTRGVRPGIIYSKLDFHHPCTKSWHVTVKAARCGKPAFFYGKAMPNLGM